MTPASDQRRSVVGEIPSRSLASPRPSHARLPGCWRLGIRPGTSFILAESTQSGGTSANLGVRMPLCGVPGTGPSVPAPIQRAPLPCIAGYRRRHRPFDRGQRPRSRSPGGRSGRVGTTSREARDRLRPNGTSPAWVPPGGTPFAGAGGWDAEHGWRPPAPRRATGGTDPSSRSAACLPLLRRSDPSRARTLGPLTRATATRGPGSASVRG
jgi:hypothetical protein